MTAGPFSRPGAIDLSALSGAPSAARSPSGPSAARPAGAYVMDVTEQSFQSDVVDQSLTVPVVLDFWAGWCQPCKQLSPILERLADEYAGRFVLAKVDVDANQQLAAAVGAQSIPLVIAVVGGQPVPLFQGALPESEVRTYLDELLKVAAANGVTGTAQPQVSAAEPADQPGADASPDVLPTPSAEADAALERGDLQAAITAYAKVLANAPADADALSGLARAQLVTRTRGLNAEAVRSRAASAPDDIEAQLSAADLDVIGGHLDDAFGRLIALVSRTSGEQRDEARRRLLDLFRAVGDNDPQVRSARQRLAAALF